MTASASPPRTVRGLSPEELYLDLMKNVLTRFVFGEHYESLDFDRDSFASALFQPVRRMLAKRRLEVVRRNTWDPSVRGEGGDWPTNGETMIGLKRLDNLQQCVTDVIRRGVPGDLIETGVWRGGAVIFMRAILAAYGDTTRTVWAADSFQGLPRPDAEKYPADVKDELWTFDQLAVSLEQVKANFERYGLLDDRVRFLVGWFKDTLPAAPIERLAVARLDGDMYGSTMDALTSLYPRLSVGGYLIVDDYGVMDTCKQAIHDYRERQGIREEIVPIDNSGVFWRRER